MSNGKSLSAGLILLIVVVVLGIVGAKFCIYSLAEWEQAVITEFGEVKGEPVTEAGLHFRLPWYQVNRYDKRLLRWDGSQTTTITRDRRTVNIDVTARWKIDNARQFLEAIRSVDRADVRLNGIIEGAIKDEIAKFDLFEVVRSSNQILDSGEDDMVMSLKDEEGEVIATEEIRTLGSNMPRLDQADDGTYEAGRPIVLDNILQEARRRIEQVGLGIRLEDVLVKQLGYIQEIESNVYAQMNAELQKIAAGFRSSGQEQAEERLGEMQLELSTIESSAVERAQKIRGNAEAEAIAIYADAYNRDPVFYELMRSLESYEKTIGENSTIILSTDSTLYPLLKSLPQED